MSNAPTNYYQVLGVSRTANPSEIKQAYRRLAQIHHPDIRLGQSEYFLQISEAYRVLSNSQLKMIHDENLENPQNCSQQSRVKLDKSANIFDFFKKFLKSHYDFEVSALESIQGAIKNVIVDCGGRIQTVKVKVPSGIKSGDKLICVLPGALRFVRLKIRVLNHPYLERRGSDIIFRIPITENELFSVGEILVPTPGGRVAVKIPKNYDGKSLIRLKKQGFHLKSGKKANIYIKLELVKFSRDIVQYKRELNVVLK